MTLRTNISNDDLQEIDHAPQHNEANQAILNLIDQVAVLEATSVIGPLTIDRSQTSGQQLADGVVIATLTPGILVDVSWRVPTRFDAQYAPYLTYVGTSEINFMHAPEGDGYGPGSDTSGSPNGRVVDAAFQLGTSDVQVGDWVMPAGIEQRSLTSCAYQLDYYNFWGGGIVIPDTPDLDLIIKIDDGSGGYFEVGPADQSTQGVVQFYVQLLPLAAP